MITGFVIFYNLFTNKYDLYSVDNNSTQFLKAVGTLAEAELVMRTDYIPRLAITPTRFFYDTSGTLLRTEE